MRPRVLSAGIRAAEYRIADEGTQVAPASLAVRMSDNPNSGPSREAMSCCFIE